MPNNHLKKEGLEEAGTILKQKTSTQFLFRDFEPKTSKGSLGQ